MSKQIVLEKSARADIIKTFGVSSKSLWEALTFKTHSRRANMLRAAALVRKGVIVDSQAGTKEQPFTTYWTENPHQMIQMFSDRVWLVVECDNTNKASIEVDGNEYESHRVDTLDQLRDVQRRAREINEQLSA